MGAAWLLPRVVGLGHASELLFTGDIIGAEHAARIGLVNRWSPPRPACPSPGPGRQAGPGPRLAHGMTKKMIEDEATLSLEAAPEAEAQAQAICMAHSRLPHRPRRLQKQSPVFEGRS
ncbi:MAG: hypothetical protein R3F43_30525 [bacterium]